MSQQRGSRAQGDSRDEVLVFPCTSAAVEMNDGDGVDCRRVVGDRGPVEQLDALGAVSCPQAVEVDLRDSKDDVSGGEHEGEDKATTISRLARTCIF